VGFFFPGRGGGGKIMACGGKKGKKGKGGK